MAKYSIRDLEKLSGIKAHTIRIWEKRYGVLEPHRTDTNIRFYDDTHLKHLLNVSLLVNHGHKISHVSKWTSDKISETLVGLFNETTEFSNGSVDAKLNGMIVAMMELDEERFVSIFSSSSAEVGLLATIQGLIYPLLQKIGIMWGINEINPAQEHFISNLIRQKLIVSIDQLPIASKNADKYLLFLPEGEFHELGLLVSQYLLRSSGKQTVYLGANVPFEDIAKINRIAKPEFLFTYFTTADTEDSIRKAIASFSLNFESKKILIGGASYLFKGISMPENVEHIASIENLLEKI